VPSAERRTAQAVAARHRDLSWPAPPAGPLADRQERPAADDCSEAAGFGKDPTIVVMPPRTVLVKVHRLLSSIERLGELTIRRISTSNAAAGHRYAEDWPTLTTHAGIEEHEQSWSVSSRGLGRNKGQPWIITDTSCPAHGLFGPLGRPALCPYNDEVARELPRRVRGLPTTRLITQDRPRRRPGFTS
jgi:hypothetical protein